MVFIEASIKPFKLDDVKEALEELGIGGMTVVEVLQAAEAKPKGRFFGSPGMPAGLVPKIRIEVAVPSEIAERVIEAICLHGSTGKAEDGRIVVTRLGSVVRIRTGEADMDALSI